MDNTADTVNTGDAVMEMQDYIERILRIKEMFLRDVLLSVHRDIVFEFLEEAASEIAESSLFSIFCPWRLECKSQVIIGYADIHDIDLASGSYVFPSGSVGQASSISHFTSLMGKKVTHVVYDPNTFDVSISLGYDCILRIFPVTTVGLPWHVTYRKMTLRRVD